MYIKATSDNGIWKRNFYGGSELKQEDQLRASHTMLGKRWWDLEQAGGPECSHVCPSHPYASLATA